MKKLFYKLAPLIVWMLLSFPLMSIGIYHTMHITLLYSLIFSFVISLIPPLVPTILYWNDTHTYS
jgi:hypothetical protein